MGGQAFHQGIRPGTLGHGNPAQYDYATIAGYLEQARPEGLGGVAEAYAMVQKALGETEGNLGKHVQRLNMIWKGGAKELGIADMRMLTEATGTLATASGQFSTAMHSGYTAMKISQHSMPPTSTPLGTLPSTNPAEAMATKLADDKAAQQHLAKTNTALTSAFDQIPSSVTFDLSTTGEGTKKFGGTASGEPPASAGVPAANGPGTPGGGAGGAAGGGAGAGGADSSGGPASRAPSGHAVPAPHGGSAGPPAGNGPRLGDGPGRGGSDLAGTRPGMDNAPEPTSPPSVGPGTGPERPSSPSFPASPGGVGYPLPNDGGFSQRPPSRPSPTIGSPAPRLPSMRIPGDGGIPPTRPGMGPLSAGGVIGRNGAPSLGETGAGPAGSLRGERVPRLPSGGVLGNERLPIGEAGSQAPAGTRYGARENAGGMPLGGMGAAAGRNAERTREVRLLEEADLWLDDADVAPRVIGGAG
ncbi:hypothetical protein amrb99_97600 [Actinomadura sp. RB99]|nr:hypothetical protein [Actinomadura sp. RB99]